MPQIVIWVGRLALAGAGVSIFKSADDISDSLKTAAPWLAVAAVAYVAARGIK